MDDQHRRLNQREFAQTPGDSEGQGRLAGGTLWGHKELDKTEQLNTNKFMVYFLLLTLEYNLQDTKDFLSWLVSIFGSQKNAWHSMIGTR